MIRNILVTGCRGFVGTNLMDVLDDLKDENLQSLANNFGYYNYEIGNVVGVDFCGHGSIKNGSDNIKHSEDFYWFDFDINNKEEMRSLVEMYDIDIILHLAAESHVDRSIDDVSPFIKSNICGTGVILDLVREFNLRLVHVSTDEVLGQHPISEVSAFSGFGSQEVDPITPRNPYSATKASAEHLVQAYIETYDIDAIITRCVNNYGHYQDGEKMIPTILRSFKENSPVPLYGDGTNIREWVHVLTHACNILRAVNIDNNSLVNNVVHIFSEFRMSNKLLVERIADIIGYESDKLYEFVSDRAGHDQAYALSTMYSDDSEGFVLDPIELTEEFNLEVFEQTILSMWEIETKF